MINGLLGKKVGMTNLFEENGDLIPVTILEVGPCKVVQVKDKEKDGYSAVQIGFSDMKKNVNKPIAGHFKKANLEPMRHLREVSLTSGESAAVGTVFLADIFKEGEYVDVIGTSKGKGFQGVIKRHHFHGSPGSRGTHESFRGGGSIGMHTYPARVLKGKKMAGHMGDERVTVKNIKVVKIVTDKNIVMVRGAVPGHNGALIEIRKIK